jgi:hypothetical protein
LIRDEFQREAIATYPFGEDGGGDGESFLVRECD